MDQVMKWKELEARNAKLLRTSKKLSKINKDAKKSVRRYRYMLVALTILILMMSALFVSRIVTLGNALQYQVNQSPVVQYSQGTIDSMEENLISSCIEEFDESARNDCVKIVAPMISCATEAINSGKFGDGVSDYCAQEIRDYAEALTDIKFKRG